MTLNCIHIFIVTGSFLYWWLMRPASQRFFIHSFFYLRILIISYLATFHGTNRLSVLMCLKAVNQSIMTSFQHQRVLVVNLRLPERRCQLVEVEQASDKLIKDRSYVVVNKPGQHLLPASAKSVNGFMVDLVTSFCDLGIWTATLTWA